MTDQAREVAPYGKLIFDKEGWTEDGRVKDFAPRPVEDNDALPLSTAPTVGVTSEEDMAATAESTRAPAAPQQ